MSFSLLQISINLILKYKYDSKLQFATIVLKHVFFHYLYMNIIINKLLLFTSYSFSNGTISFGINVIASEL